MIYGLALPKPKEDNWSLESVPRMTSKDLSSSASCSEKHLSRTARETAFFARQFLRRLACFLLRALKTLRNSPRPRTGQASVKHPSAYTNSSLSNVIASQLENTARALRYQDMPSMLAPIVSTCKRRLRPSSERRVDFDIELPCVSMREMPRRTSISMYGWTLWYSTVFPHDNDSLRRHSKSQCNNRAAHRLLARFMPVPITNVIKQT